MDRKDTGGGRGGGILTYVGDGLRVTEQTDELLSKFNQATCISIDTKNGPYKIFTIYRPPSSNEDNNSALNRLIAAMSSGRAVFVGDFNFRQIDWDNSRMYELDRHAESFLDTVTDSFLTQCVCVCVCVILQRS